MAIESITVKYSGIDQLIINNPQSVDPFNKFSKELKALTNTKKKTDETYAEIFKTEIRSKIYFDESIGIYVPATWVLASINENSHAIAKIAKKKARAAVFATEPKLKLTYRGMEKVKTPADIVSNSEFHLIQGVKQGQVRIPKAMPIFDNWSFTTTLEYDTNIINERDLKKIIEYGASYGGMGDWRPTYGRATIEWL